MQYLDAFKTKQTIAELQNQLKNNAVTEQSLINTLDQFIMHFKASPLQLSQYLDENMSYFALICDNYKVSLRLTLIYLLTHTQVCLHIVHQFTTLKQPLLNTDELKMKEEIIHFMTQQIKLDLEQKSEHILFQILFKVQIERNMGITLNVQFENKLKYEPLQLQIEQLLTIQTIPTMQFKSPLFVFFIAYLFQNMKFEEQQYQDLFISQFKNNQFQFDQSCLKLTGIQLEDYIQDYSKSKNEFNSKLNSILMARSQKFANKKEMSKIAKDLGYKGEIFVDNIPAPSVNVSLQQFQSSEDKESSKLIKQVLPIFTHAFAACCQFTKFNPFDRTVTVQKKTILLEEIFNYFSVSDFDLFSLNALFYKNASDEERTEQLLQQLDCLCQLSLYFFNISKNMHVFTTLGNLVQQVLQNLAQSPIPLSINVKANNSILNTCQLFQLENVYIKAALVLPVDFILNSGQFSQFITKNLNKNVFWHCLQKLKTRFDLNQYRVLLVNVLKEVKNQVHFDNQTSCILQNAFGDLSFEQLFINLIEPVISQFELNTEANAKTCFEFTCKMKFLIETVLAYTHTKCINVFSFYEGNEHLNQYKALIEQICTINSKYQNISTHEMRNKVSQMEDKSKKELMSKQLDEIDGMNKYIDEYLQVIKQELRMNETKHVFEVQKKIINDSDLIDMETKLQNDLQIDQELLCEIAIQKFDQILEKGLINLFCAICDPTYFYLEEHQANIVYQSSKNKMSPQIALKLASILTEYNFDKLVSEVIASQTLDKDIKKLIVLLDYTIENEIPNKKLVGQIQDLCIEADLNSVIYLHQIIQGRAELEKLQNKLKETNEFYNVVFEQKFEDKFVTSQFIKYSIAPTEGADLLGAISNNLKFVNTDIFDHSNYLKDILIFATQLMGQEVSKDLVNLVLQHIGIYSAYFNKKLNTTEQQKLKIQLISILKAFAQFYDYICFQTTDYQTFHLVFQVLVALLQLDYYKDPIITMYYQELCVPIQEGINLSLQKNRQWFIFKMISVVLFKSNFAEIQQPFVKTFVLGMFSALKYQEQLKFIGLEGIDDDVLEIFKKQME
ncbi:Conserved_hypothetical protein [Hexamita inflata]|uniref:Uncharacterized protein n=1 Tax=Hexamita inflata TaxID=28002 RepID=A0AA86NQH9_9EUKA|nr:Conserved hypothetical protein [Hexamita inflata]CAI9954073.1 Conserved hypothetical protein [Hexamita inflata]